jgi:chemotaxis signal transduction protein
MMNENDRQDIALQLDELQHRLDELRRRIGASERHNALPPGELAVLSCRVGAERVAFLHESIDSVVMMAKLTVLPEVPIWVPGILNFHGASIPVIDVLSRVTGQPRRPDITDFIIIARTGSRQVGLIVQEIFDVDRINGDTLERGTTDISFAPYLFGLVPSQGHQILVLDIDRLFATSDVPEVAP